MRHSLPSVGAIVDDDPEAVFSVAFLPGDFADFEQEVTEELLVICVGFGDPGDRFLGDEKKMDRCLW